MDQLEKNMIREARIEDIPHILRIIHESIRTCIDDHQRDESSIQILLEEMSQANLTLWMLYNDSWVYVDEYRIAGVIMVNDQGNILLNYVAPEMQLRGFGKALLLKLFETCTTKNITQLSLESTQTALPFYQKYGFESPEPSDSDSLLLVKQLSPL